MRASDYRQIARENLRGSWLFAICVAAVAFLLGGTLEGASFLPEIQKTKEVIQCISGNIHIQEVTATTSLLSRLALPRFILGGITELCYALYLLRQYQHQTTTMEDITPMFERFFQGFLQSFLRGLFAFLWALLLLIPGIIAHYSYAMTPYIMIERPELTPMEAIAASKELMQGHKWELFCLDFSFIGWDLLAALTLNLGHLALNPYKNAARTAFYRNIVAQR